MKKNAKQRKLQLSRETLQQLSADALSDVKGGTLGGPTAASCPCGGSNNSCGETNCHSQ